MKIAKVIVDVPANQTDRYFDYLVPKEWVEADFLQPGMPLLKNIMLFHAAKYLTLIIQALTQV